MLLLVNIRLHVAPPLMNVTRGFHRTHYGNVTAAAMDIIKDGPRTGKWPPIHSYTNCSVAQGNIQERFASALWGQDTWPSP
jgi:hypothetical protein